MKKSITISNKLKIISNIEMSISISCNSFKYLLLRKHLFLDENELSYFHSLPAEKRQYSYLNGRYTAKKALESHLNVPQLLTSEISHGVFFQPVIHSPYATGIQVSITHSENWAASLVFPEAYPMGIDIEVITSSRDWDQILALTPHEQHLITVLKNQVKEIHTAIWTVKEALAKALKTGLTIDIKLYEINSIKQSNGVLESTFTHFIQHKAYSWYAKGCYWSVAAPRAVSIDGRKIMETINTIPSS